MEREGEETHVTPTESSGGGGPRIMRSVLLISLTLTIVLLSAIWMFGASRSAQPNSTTISGQATPTS
ncbi:hypothetical protein [Novosphingobium sp. FKTRR1]|uniref:hypothetical protein n=1 Tax=Novosphingobium sp. FKTRR1 TaxID=2879118 RepID=UPI001CF0D533|nr:hypothetical protein [Novosphingobium sp. FKTRR1]